MTMATDVHKNALKRVWSSWKWGFIVALIVYLVVFARAFTYEAHGRDGEKLSEEPVEIFQVNFSPQLQNGVNEYIVNITNNQIYTINEVRVEFAGTTFKNVERHDSEFSDSLSAGSEKSYDFPIYGGALGVDLALEGDILLQGMTDLNLYLENEAGTFSWESRGGSNSEEIHLTDTDIAQGGPGNYKATVRHEDGFRSIDYILVIRVIYKDIELIQKSTKPIEPGGTKEFKFTLRLDTEQINDVICKVDGRLDITENVEVTIRLNYDSTWTLTDAIRPIPEQAVENIPWGPVDLTGTSSAIMYSFTVLFGFAFFFRARSKKVMDPKIIRKGHCFISLITLMLVLAHMSNAIQKDWPWASAGMRFAVIATVLLISLNLFSFFDVEIIRKIGIKKWRFIHILFTISMALSIIIHFGLMGDHLGFLK